MQIKTILIVATITLSCILSGGIALLTTLAYTVHNQNMAMLQGIANLKQTHPVVHSDAFLEIDPNHNPFNTNNTPPNGHTP